MSLKPFPLQAFQLTHRYCPLAKPTSNINCLAQEPGDFGGDDS